MKSRREINEEAQKKAEEKKLLLFEKNIIEHGLINDEVYMFEQMKMVRLNLKEFPKEHLDNPILMAEYFKTPRDVSNYKYIKPNVLSNKIFLSVAIEKNPEIYLIISDENKVLFKEKAIKNDKEYLKYLSKEDYSREDIQKGVCFNFASFNESLGCITQDIMSVLRSCKYTQPLLNNILELPLEKCEKIKLPLRDYLINYNERISNDQNVWLKKTIWENPNLFSVLEPESKYVKDMKDFVIELVGRRNNLFKYMPQDWRGDTDVILKIISSSLTKEKVNQISEKSMSLHPNERDLSCILNEMEDPIKFLKESADKIQFKKIRNVYPKLKKEIREQEYIIKMLFKERDAFYISLDFLRSIPNEELAEKLADQLKRNNNPTYKRVYTDSTRTLANVGNLMEKTLNLYYMDKHLENIPADPESKIEKPKNKI